MLLILSNKLDPTTDAVIKRLNDNHIPFVRWNTEDMLRLQKITLEIVAGKPCRAILTAEGRTIDLLNDISVIWYRRPEKLQPHRAIRKLSHREFTIREGATLLNNLWALLEDKTWINHPRCNIALNNKLFQLSLAEELGMDTPPTLLTNDPREIIKFKARYGEIAAKSLSAGVIHEHNGEKMMYTRKLRNEDMINLDSVRLCPTFFQSYIPKQLELRITVIEESVFACAIESQRSTKTMEDWRRYDFSKVPHYPFNLPDKLRTGLVMFLKKSGLKFGAFDFILTPNGQYVFLEINPNGQWYWIEKLTGLPITDRLVQFFQHSILERR